MGVYIICMFVYLIIYIDRQHSESSHASERVTKAKANPFAVYKASPVPPLCVLGLFLLSPPSLVSKPKLNKKLPKASSSSSLSLASL